MGNLQRCGLPVVVGDGVPTAVALTGQPVRHWCARFMIVASNLSGDRREAYLPAQQPPPSPQARIPCAHEHPGRSGRAQVPSRQGPRPSVGLIGRIQQRDAFVRLRREGIRLRIDPLWCSFVPDSRVIPPRVGFAIGRATGSAVERNRLRRRLRAVLRTCDVPPGLVLIGAQPHACERTFGELEASVRQLTALMSARSRPST